MTPRPAGDDWQPCPTGLLVDAAGAERSRVSRRRALRIGGAAVASLCVGGAVLALRTLKGTGAEELASDKRPVKEELSCVAVQPLLPRFMKSELAAETRARVERHLARCGHCRSILETLQEGRA